MSVIPINQNPSIDGDDPIATTCALDVLGERMRLADGGAHREIRSVRDFLVSIAAQSLVALERYDRRRISEPSMS